MKSYYLFLILAILMMGLASAGSETSEDQCAPKVYGGLAFIIVTHVFVTYYLLFT